MLCTYTRKNYAKQKKGVCVDIYGITNKILILIRDIKTNKQTNSTIHYRDKNKIHNTNWTILFDDINITAGREYMQVF